MKQRTIFLCMWGGARPGAGRKKQKGSGVPHRKRERFTSWHPVHVTIRLRDGLPRLRRRREFAAVKAAFLAAGRAEGFRIVEFAVLGNHLHILIEAESSQRLSRGMQGLLVRLAHSLNRLWDRRGQVFADRYHDRVLRKPREVRNALAYVLCNARKHGLRVDPRRPDPYSSGTWFEGWRDMTAPGTPRSAASPVARARTWLLNVGWRRHGLIPLACVPGGG